MIANLKINKTSKNYYYKAGYWTKKTIVDFWNEKVRLHPQKIYVKDDQMTLISYLQCDTMASRIASWLSDIGISPGDVVTIQLPTWAEYAPLYLGVAKAGAVIHPVAYNSSLQDLGYVMNKVKSKALICPAGFHGVNYESQVIECLKTVSSLSHDTVMLVEKMEQSKTHTFTSFADVTMHSHNSLSFPSISSDSVACILSTSGTTGKPKQALLTHNNILFSERVFAKGFHRTESDIMFMPSPLHHATGLFHGLIAPMLLGGTTVLQQTFSAEQAIQLINKERATWSMGATPFIYDILKMLEKGQKTPSLKLFVSGGASLPRSLVQKAHNHGILLCECYGSTESCPHVYVPPENCSAWDGRWSGIPFEGIETRTVDHNHNDVPCGKQGEEASRGPHVFVGYLGDKPQTDLSLDDNGWFYSGDLGILDTQGRLRINGRIKEIVVRGGENISANEVDECVMGWQSVTDHATAGIPDERMGERICLFAVPADPGAELCLDDLQTYLRNKGVSKRLWPEKIVRLACIPRTTTGKVKRYILSEILSDHLPLEENSPAE